MEMNDVKKLEVLEKHNFQPYFPDPNTAVKHPILAPIMKMDVKIVKLTKECSDYKKILQDMGIPLNEISSPTFDATQYKVARSNEMAKNQPQEPKEVIKEKIVEKVVEKIVYKTDVNTQSASLFLFWLSTLAPRTKTKKALEQFTLDTAKLSEIGLSVELFAVWLKEQSPDATRKELLEGFEAYMETLSNSEAPKVVGVDLASEGSSDVSVETPIQAEAPTETIQIAEGVEVPLDDVPTASDFKDMNDGEPTPVGQFGIGGQIQRVLSKPTESPSTDTPTSEAPIEG